ncbi:MAG: response regulator [Pseudomonadota bacterium]
MNTLLVDDVKPRLELWARHLERNGLSVAKSVSASDAYQKLAIAPFDAMVLNMAMPGGEALSIADYAIFRLPKISIIAVTSDRFFSDGSLFQIIPNLRSHVSETVPVEDLGATLAHYAQTQKEHQPRP